MMACQEEESGSKSSLHYSTSATVNACVGSCRIEAESRQPRFDLRSFFQNLQDCSSHGHASPCRDGGDGQNLLQTHSCHHNRQAIASPTLRIREELAVEVEDQGDFWFELFLKALPQFSTHLFSSFME